MATSRYRTDQYLIDIDAREIRCADTIIDVEAKVFDLIALLLANRDRALSKRELNAALWNDRPVTDAALTQQLRKARRALGDDGNTQRVIRTVHGHGLRWVAAVTAESADAPALLAGQAAARPTPSTPMPARRRPYLRLAALAALLLLAVAVVVLRNWSKATTGDASVVRVAVLPVDDRTGDATLAWTRNGLMGLMAGLFEQGDRIEVVAARTVQAVDASADPPDVATTATLRHALGATHLVASRLTRIGPLYELDLRLIANGDAERRETLHSTSPTPLAVAAVAQVRRWLNLGTVPNTDGRGIASPFLAEAYARGLDAQLHGDHAGALKYFAICLDQDPGLAWPRLGLAIAQGATGDAASSAANASRVAAAAREYDDGELLIAAQRQLAAIAFRRGDLDGAAAHLDEALRAVPANSHPLVQTDLLVAQASIEDERGHFARSRELFDRALQLARDTGNRRGEASVLVNLASLDNGAGDAAAAATLLRAGLDAARQAGDSSLEAVTLGNLGATEANRGHLLSAIALLKQGIAVAHAHVDAHLETLTLIQLVWALAPFEQEPALQALTHRIATAAEGGHNAFWQAETHWLRGSLAARRQQWEASMDELERARDLYASEGMTRSVAPVLALMVETASTAGLGKRAHAAADAFRVLAASDGAAGTEWLALIDAQLRKVDGDASGALDDLTRHLDANPHARGAAAQAALFQLGRWQLAAGHFEDLLSRPAWAPWLEQHPDAITLRIAALRASSQLVAAAAETFRLERLRQAPELDTSDLPAAL